MRVALFTNEFPPHIYGGAGVHVDFLSRELKKRLDLEVRCFGDQKLDEERLSVRGVSPLRDWHDFFRARRFSASSCTPDFVSSTCCSAAFSSSSLRGSTCSSPKSNIGQFGSSA